MDNALKCQGDREHPLAALIASSVSREALDFASFVLAFDSSARPTARMTLQHSYLSFA